MKINEKLIACPCGCKEIELKKEPLWHGNHGYQGCYNIKLKCINPKCPWEFHFEKNDTIYRTEEEAIKNIITQWNEGQK